MSKNIPLEISKRSSYNRKRTVEFLQMNNIHLTELLNTYLKSESTAIVLQTPEIIDIIFEGILPHIGQELTELFRNSLNTTIQPNQNCSGAQIQRFIESIKDLQAEFSAANYDGRDCSAIFKFFCRNHFNQHIAIKEYTLEQDATRDPLTSAFTRRVFHQRLTAEVANVNSKPVDSANDNNAENAYVAHSIGCAVIFADIDNFKQLNDTHGHAVGDQVLIAVVERLTSLVRPTDVVARIGGDEICVLLPNITKKDAVAKTRQIQNALAKGVEFQSGKETIFVGITIGMAHGSIGTSVEALMNDADEQMYDNKSGRSQTVALALPRP